MIFFPTLRADADVGSKCQTKTIYEFVKQNGYAIYDDKLQPFREPPERGMPNIFCIHRDAARA
jgi:hypothetical protein